MLYTPMSSFFPSFVPLPRQHQHCLRRIEFESVDRNRVPPHQLLYLAGRAIPDPNPDYLWWWSMQETSLLEVRILRCDHVAVVACESPHRVIIRFGQSKTTGMSTVRKQISQASKQARRQVLIEEKLHQTIVSFLSRSAANARHARTSSSVSSGKSERISGMDVPPAR